MCAIIDLVVIHRLLLDQEGSTLLADQHTIKSDPRYDFSTSRRTKAIITVLIDWMIEKINQGIAFSLFTPAQEASKTKTCECHDLCSGFM